MLELLKLLVQPVILERGADGAVTGERLGEAVPLYSLAQVKAYLANLDAEVAQANSQPNTNGGGPMPITERTVSNVVCDNANCPGNNLDSGDRAGWLFVSTEIYGEPLLSHVVCSATCLAVIAAEPGFAEAEQPGAPVAP